MNARETAYSIFTNRKTIAIMPFEDQQCRLTPAVKQWQTELKRLATRMVACRE